jgi:hypothetical protein
MEFLYYNKDMKINKLKVGIALLVIIVTMFILDIILMTKESTNQDYWEFAQIFDTEAKVGLPALYTLICLLLIPGLLMIYIGKGKKAIKDKYALHWTILGYIFCFFAFDKGIMLHNKMGTVVRLLGFQDNLDSVNPGLFHWSWWVIYMPIAFVIALFYIKWYIHLPLRYQLIFLAAGVLTISGQVVIEAICGSINYYTGEWPTELRGVEKLVSRGGLSLFLWGLLDYISFLPSKARPTIGQITVK